MNEESRQGWHLRGDECINNKVLDYLDSDPSAVCNGLRDTRVANLRPKCRKEACCCLVLRWRVNQVVWASRRGYEQQMDGSRTRPRADFFQDDENRSKSEDGSIGISVRFGTGQRRATNLGTPLAIRCQLVISSPPNPAFGCCP